MAAANARVQPLASAGHPIAAATSPSSDLAQRNLQATDMEEGRDARRASSAKEPMNSDRLSGLPSDLSVDVTGFLTRDDLARLTIVSPTIRKTVRADRSNAEALDAARPLPASRTRAEFKSSLERLLLADSDRLGGPHSQQLCQTALNEAPRLCYALLKALKENEPTESIVGLAAQLAPLLDLLESYGVGALATHWIVDYLECYGASWWISEPGVIPRLASIMASQPSAQEQPSLRMLMMACSVYKTNCDLASAWDDAVVQNTRTVMRLLLASDVGLAERGENVRQFMENAREDIDGCIKRLQRSINAPIRLSNLINSLSFEAKLSIKQKLDLLIQSWPGSAGPLDFLQMMRSRFAAVAPTRREELDAVAERALTQNAFILDIHGSIDMEPALRCAVARRTLEQREALRAHFGSLPVAALETARRRISFVQDLLGTMSDDECRFVRLTEHVLTTMTESGASAATCISRVTDSLANAGPMTNVNPSVLLRHCTALLKTFSEQERSLVATRLASQDTALQSSSPLVAMLRKALARINPSAQELTDFADRLLESLAAPGQSAVRSVLSELPAGAEIRPHLQITARQRTPQQRAVLRTALAARLEQEVDSPRMQAWLRLIAAALREPQ